MVKRKLVSHLLNCIPRSGARLYRHIKYGGTLIVLTYHRVMNIKENFLFDEDLISASEKQFSSQLEFISKNYDVINFKKLKKIFESGHQFPARSLIITFDDGYIDNYTVAFKLLRKYGLTATMFVSAGYIGTDRLFWWDKIAFIIKSTDASNININGPLKINMNLDEFTDRQQASSFLINRAKTLPENEKKQLINKLSEDLEVDFEKHKIRNTMSWDQLKEIRDSGIEIGAHSVNHPIFSNISLSSLNDEIINSKKIIEDKLGTDVISFGSPGRGIIPPSEVKEFKDNLRNLIIESGYSFGTNYQRGLNYKDTFDSYGIKRIGIERYDSEAVYKAKLAFPEIIRY